MMTRTRSTRSALVILAVVWLGAPIMTWAQTPRVGSLTAERWAELNAELQANHQSVLGLVPLLELEALTRWVPYPQLATALEPVLGHPDTHPAVRGWAAHRMARTELARGDVEASEARIAREGYLTNFSILGPFPNDSMAGFDTPYEPELRRHLSQQPEGRNGPTSWRNVTDLVRLGYVDLGRMAPPARSSVVYAVTQIETRDVIEGQLWTSVDGAFKIWLNGELVARVDTDLGGGPVREWWPVRLPRGANELVVKAAGGEGGLGFYLRLANQDGLPLSGWFSTATFFPTETPLAGSGNPIPNGSLLGSLTDLLLGPGEGAEDELSGAALVMRTAYPQDSSEPWRTFVTRAGSCLDAPARALLRCNRVQSHYWERHRSLTRAARLLEEREGGSDLAPWVALALAELAYGGTGEGTLEEARSHLDRLLARHPDFVPARLLLARIDENERWVWRAHATIMDALADAPDNNEAIDRAVWSHRTAGDVPQVLELLERRLAGAWDDGASVVAAVRALSRASRYDEALLTLDRALTVDPLAIGLRSLRADLLVSRGRFDEAEATLLELSELVPSNVSAWEELAQFYVLTDDTDSALAAFDAALALEPQNQEVAQYRAELAAEADDFYEPYALDLAAIEALELPDEMTEGRDYVVLAQQQLARVYENGLSAQYVQEAFRVQTRQGADQLREYGITFTPDDETVEILSARIVKPDGRVVESFERWEESLSQPWYGLYYDYRALVLGFEDLAPGDVLEVQYTLSQVGSHNIFDDYYGAFWFAQGGQPIAFLRLGVLSPDSMRLNVREPRLEHETVDTVEAGVHHQVYALEDVPRVEMEPNMPGLSAVADFVHFSTFDDWDQVATWYWNLIDEQLVTSPEIEQTVEELTADLQTTAQRVQAIHEYVVRNTRYVGLEFGVHGYRPYRTTVSFARRFGDCKDTASLMKVMLGLAGIESHVVLVRTRDLGTLEADPPSLSVFNHAIAYVPELELYLDGTAGFSGIDELPSSDQGATVLIVGDGRHHEFWTIPFSPAASNRLSYTLDVDLTEDGAPTRGEMRATGQFAPPQRVRYEAEENRLEEFQRVMADDYPGAAVSTLAFEGLENINQPVVASFELSGATWLRGDGRPSIRPLGFETDLGQRLAGSATRLQPLVLDFPFQTHHEVRYRLPDSLGIGSDPLVTELESPFGRFALRLEPTHDGVLAIADFEITVVEVSVRDYPAFREFVQAAEQAINRRVSLARLSDG